MILTILFYSMVFSIGLSFVSILIKQKQNILEVIGLSFGIGVILVWLLSQLIFVFHIEFWIVILIFFLIFLTSLYKLKKGFILAKSRRIHLLEKFMIFGIIVNTVFVFIQSFIHPLIAWDGIASWFFGGKALAIDKRLYSEFYHYANYDFPNLFPSLVAFQSIFIGGYGEALSLIIFPILYVVFLLLFFSVILKEKGLFIALLFTFLFGSTQEVLRQSGYLDAGYVDIVLSYFILGSGILYLKYQEKREFSFFIAMELFLLGAAFTKNEGFVYYCLFQLLVLLALFKDKTAGRVKYVACILILAIPVVVWLLYKTYFLPPNYRFEGHLFLYINTFIPSIINIFTEFLNIQRWNFMWVLIALLVPSIIREKKLRYLFLLNILLVCVYIVIYFVAPINPIIHIKGSFDRLLLHVYPMLLLLAALSIKKDETFRKMIKL